MRISANFFYNNAESVKALIEAKANVNMKDKAGRTALIYAAREGQIEAVKALIEAGADVNAVDSFYRTTALSVAQNPAIIKLLKDSSGISNADPAEAPQIRIGGANPEFAVISLSCYNIAC